MLLIAWKSRLSVIRSRLSKIRLRLSSLKLVCIFSSLLVSKLTRIIEAIVAVSGFDTDEVGNLINEIIGLLNTLISDIDRIAGLGLTVADLLIVRGVSGTIADLAGVVYSLLAVRSFFFSLVRFLSERSFLLARHPSPRLSTRPCRFPESFPCYPHLLSRVCLFLCTICSLF
jgi:hypothetical protein